MLLQCSPRCPSWGYRRSRRGGRDSREDNRGCPRRRSEHGNYAQPVISPVSRRLLFVHAHPDDESITTGASIARYAAEGAEVTVVTCTLGEEGEVMAGLRELDGLRAHAADQLGGHRVTELMAACAALGVSRHRYLGGLGRWRDSGMAGTPSASHPRAFTGGGAGGEAPPPGGEPHQGGAPGARTPPPPRRPGPPPPHPPPPHTH